MHGSGKEGQTVIKLKYGGICVCGKRKGPLMNKETLSKPTLVDALARVMRKDRVASDTLSELTSLPELSEGTSPNANAGAVHESVQRHSRFS